MTDPAVIRWGIIGPGTIAQRFAANLARTTSGKLVAIGTRNPEKPGLAEAFAGARILAGYQALIDDPEVQAIYIATPHPFHAEWAIKAVETGKHVLVEKPMAVSAYEAEAMIHAARKASVFLGEAFMNLLHPHTGRVIELIRSGAIGEVMMVKAAFGFRVASADPTHRLLANDTAGGGILDICCYPVAMARLIAGVAAGEPFLNPNKVSGIGHLGATGADEWASAVLQFPNEVVAEVSGSVRVAQDNRLRVYGSTGWLEAMSPWFCSGREGGSAEIVIHRPDGPDETVTVTEPRWLYTFEIDAVAEAIRAGRQEFTPPGMTWANTLGNMRVLDKWRSDIGLHYDFEKPERRVTKIDGRPLKKPVKPMRRLRLPTLAKEVSAVALGSAFLMTYTQASILLDAFYERGGNLLDTAWGYGGGRCETLLGQWLKARGVRDDVSVISKGVHSPLTYPDVVGRQLAESLARLNTDYLDLYFMHRDNLDIPVGEFVDAIDAEVRVGRIRAWGGSNWSRERMDEAIAYARANGKTPPTALSNNFSLATMLEAPWAGCYAASDDAWRAWLKERGIPNFAWSSQAQGFFTDRAGRDKTSDASMVRCWYSDDNFARRDRAAELAAKYGVNANQVALAYILALDLPVVPLIGPLAMVELEDSLHALQLELTPAEVRWLETGA
jgi:predicted dehydrogenase/aryl-alcohol dehydrogenase-like predicted oxidoreductase